MKNIDDKKILNIIALCILIIVPFLKFLSINLAMFGLIKNYDSINPAIVLYVSVLPLLFIYIKQIVKSKRKLDKFDYIFFALVIAGFISTIFSIDKSLALFGKEFRHEGLLSILSYYLLFINYKIYGTKDDIKKLIKLIIVVALLNSIYALLQIYTKFNFISRYYKDIHMASGLCGNPNFLGSLLVTSLGIVCSEFLIGKKFELKYLLLVILFFIGLINAQSTGPFLTLVLVVLFLIVLLLIKRKTSFKKILILVLALVATYTSVYFVNKKVFYIERCEMCVTTVKKTIKTGGTNRLTIWKNSIDIVKKNTLIGVGFDNFYLAYPNPRIENGTVVYVVNGEVKAPAKSYKIVDNAHNVYLHTWISNGLIGLIPYMLLLLLTFIKCLKTDDDLILVLSGGFVAYSIQAFANISVIQIAPIYFVIIGLILSYKSQN